MSSTDGVRSTGEALAQVCETIPDLRVLRQPGVAGAPPLVYIPPASLTWGGYAHAPTEAVFELVLAVASSPAAIEALYALLPLVTEAIDDSDVDATVVSAEPGLWRTGTVEYPAYFIRIEAAI